jgi:hypothetical protein
MATESELLELLRGLEDLLVERGLGFVVEQERALAVEGIAAEVDINPRGIHRMKGSDAVRRPLSAAERVALLLDLIEVVTAGTVEIEAVVRGELDYALSQSSPIEHTVRFSPPEEALLRGESDTSWELPGASTLAVERESAQAVVNTLDQLRAAADVQRGSWLIPEAGVDTASQAGRS